MIPGRRTARVEQGELYEMLVGALRYALGRQSHIVGSTARLVRKYARDLEPMQRDTILSDLRRYLEEDWRNEPRDVREVWQQLLDDFEAVRM